MFLVTFFSNHLFNFLFADSLLLILLTHIKVKRSGHSHSILALLLFLTISVVLRSKLLRLQVTLIKLLILGALSRLSSLFMRSLAFSEPIVPFCCTHFRVRCISSIAPLNIITVFIILIIFAIIFFVSVAFFLVVVFGSTL
jgi:hypothetical protein